MEIKKELNVPASFFFDKIADSAIFDIQHHTGKSVPRRQLKNFEYVKQFGKNSRAKIKIDKFVDNVVYAFSTDTTKNHYYVSYTVEPLTEKSCAVTYQESMESYGFLQKANDLVVGLLWSRLRKRRFKAMLAQIEASY